MELQGRMVHLQHITILKPNPHRPELEETRQHLIEVAVLLTMASCGLLLLLKMKLDHLIIPIVSLFDGVGELVQQNISKEQIR